MAIHWASPSEALPLQERAHRPTHSSASGMSGTGKLKFDDDFEVSPFADPGAAASNPFADPRWEADVKLPQAPTAAARAPVDERFAPFAEHPGLGSKEIVLRSPLALSSRPGYWELDGPHAQQQKRRRRRRMFWCGGLVLLAVVVIGVSVGCVVGLRVSSGPAPPGPLPGTMGVVTFTNPSDERTYVPDARLHNSFYGLGYVPYGAYEPDCQITQNNVTEDIVLLSQLTTRVRMYSAECEQDRMVLQAIRQTGVELQVYLALNLTGNNTGFYDQASEIANSLLTYETHNVGGVLVGDQFIATYLAENNTTDPNSQAGQTAASYVSSEIASMRATIKMLNLTAPVRVGTADGGDVFTPDLLQKVDFAMASVMPWRNNVSVADAAQWTWTFFKDYALSTSQATADDPAMYIGETGWPSSSLSQQNTTEPATPQALQTYLDTFVCSSNTNGTGYFWYEAFDEQWRAETYGGAEGGWGLFTSGKQLKNITLPNCTHP
ncbi:glycoside hydrolase family 17 protein [Calocera viscosa TUFC12733]|uniref:glucan endo-1,3-beta-D-glucosidase n=1 Tax=Calocera viscosa (strain TUFC12733) TaxID=1330018 RepID=A0A167QZS0_CALVF|nr:glycoside hydrolase family 17 protein [Calocera viscosa TUFC12733]